MISVTESIYEKLKNKLQVEIETTDGTLTINPDNADLVWLSKDKKDIVLSFANYHVHVYEENGELKWSFGFHSELVTQILADQHEHEFEEE